MSIKMIADNEVEKKQIIELVTKYSLDRRKKYVLHNGYLCTCERVVTDCPGCSEWSEYKQTTVYYGGCRDCGYTGKQVVHYPHPVVDLKEKCIILY